MDADADRPEVRPEGGDERRRVADAGRREVAAPHTRDLRAEHVGEQVELLLVRLAKRLPWPAGAA